MIIIFYRSKETNDIVDVHGPRDGQTMADLEPLKEAYNANPQNHRIAEVVEVADDSLEAYLYRRRNQRMKIDKDTLEDAVESIRHALYCVQALEG